MTTNRYPSNIAQSVADDFNARLWKISPGRNESTMNYVFPPLIATVYARELMHTLDREGLLITRATGQSLLTC